MKKLEKKDVGSIMIMVVLGMFAIPTILIIMYIFADVHAYRSVPDADAPWVVMQTNTELNVRYDPDTSSEVLAILPAYAPIEVQIPTSRGVNQKWARVRLPEGEFWVCYSNGGRTYLEEYNPQEEEYNLTEEEYNPTEEEYTS